MLIVITSFKLGFALGIFFALIHILFILRRWIRIKKKLKIKNSEEIIWKQLSGMDALNFRPDETKRKKQ